MPTRKNFICSNGIHNGHFLHREGWVLWLRDFRHHPLSGMPQQYYKHSRIIFHCGLQAYDWLLRSLWTSTNSMSNGENNIGTGFHLDYAVSLHRRRWVFRPSG
jgi:hypothetical protein